MLNFIRNSAKAYTMFSTSYFDYSCKQISYLSLLDSLCSTIISIYKPTLINLPEDYTGLPLNESGVTLRPYGNTPHAKLARQRK